MKKLLTLALASAIAFGLVGCEGDGDATPFVGTWVERDAVSKAPKTIDITYDRGVYLVAEHIAIGGSYKTMRDIAKVEGENVLSVKNGFRTLKLENGTLYYRTSSFVKVP